MISTKPSLSLTVYVVRLTVTTLPVDECQLVIAWYCKHSLIKLQLGGDPDHIPLAKHVLVSSPHRMNGTSQAYAIVEPRVVLAIKTFPFAKTPGCPQLIAVSVWLHKKLVKLLIAICYTGMSALPDMYACVFSDV